MVAAPRHPSIGVRNGGARPNAIAQRNMGQLEANTMNRQQAQELWDRMEQLEQRQDELERCLTAPETEKRKPGRPPKQENGQADTAV